MSNENGPWVHNTTRFGQALSKSGWSQSKLGKHIGVAQGTISRWCAGIRRPDANHLKALAPILGLEPKEIAAMFPLDDREKIVAG